MKWTSIFSSDYWTNHYLWRSSVGKFFRIALASIQGFTDDDCASKASALTFYTLLSIVPGLAVAFGIAKGFGFETLLETELRQKFPEQREVVEKLIGFAYNTLENTKGGIIAGIGLVLLFWGVLKLLANIESSFNSIWKLSRARSLSRKLSDYLAMILFCPLFFAAASSLLVFVMAELTHISLIDERWKSLNPVIVFTIRFFPFVIAWMLFTALYYVMPNTKVPFKHAFIAGIIAGTTYQITQWIYIHFQISLASYGAIYGSFAALPLFLIWLNTSWLIALAGAEIAYHSEYTINQVFAIEEKKQQADVRMIGLLTMQNACRSFHDGTEPPTITTISQNLGVPISILKPIINKLIEKGLLAEVHWCNFTSKHYLPAKPPQTINIKLVCDALNTARQELYWINNKTDLEKYQQALAAMDTIVEDSPLNSSLI